MGGMCSNHYATSPIVILLHRKIIKHQERIQNWTLGASGSFYCLLNARSVLTQLFAKINATVWGKLWTRGPSTESAPVKHHQDDVNKHRKSSSKYSSRAKQPQNIESHFYLLESSLVPFRKNVKVLSSPQWRIGRRLSPFL